MKSTVVKRSVVIAGHKTSVSLEDAFWRALKGMARDRNMPLSDVVTAIDTERERANLSSAIRLFILECYQVRVHEKLCAQTTTQHVIAEHPASSA
jgi:predicted DNA-binding ribbon-helix-helix protein